MTPESDEHVCREEESDAAQELDLVEEDSDQDNDVSVRRPQLPVRPLASVLMQPHPPHQRTWLFEIWLSMKLACLNPACLPAPDHHKKPGHRPVCKSAF